MSIQTKNRNAFPGDQVVIFTAGATDINGQEWPAGTEKTPQSSGHDNCRGASIRRYTDGTEFEV